MQGKKKWDGRPAGEKKRMKNLVWSVVDLTVDNQTLPDTYFFSTQTKDPWVTADQTNWGKKPIKDQRYKRSSRSYHSDKICFFC